MDLRSLWCVTIVLCLLVACGGNPKPSSTPENLPGDQALYDQGTAAMAKEDWDKARTLLQQLVDAYPQSSLTPRSRIAIADSYYKQDDEAHRAQAEVEYMAFISLYPFSELAAYSQFQVGMLKFQHLRIPSRDQENTQEALKAFQKVVSEYPASEYADQAKEKIQECRNRLAAHELGVGTFYLKRKSYDAAQTRLKKLIVDYPGFSQMDAAYYYIGESLLKMGKKDDAIPYYQKLTEGKPGEYSSKAAGRLREISAIKTPAGGNK